jgi:hypothetical protein
LFSLFAFAPEAVPINAGAFLQKSRKRRVRADSGPVSSEPASKQVLGLLSLGIASGAKQWRAVGNFQPLATGHCLSFNRGLALIK